MSDSTQNSQENYLVLARKYRPRKFEDLYGQDALVRTLQNAIESERLHHAYVLNGIRGTGKTTTARILAKVLNCDNGPAIKWDENDPQCLAIEKGAHVDVLEFDAASHTGVDDIRELFEGVNYAPVQGRYKVYIIDEVHMLSKQAFNALLKTLEEPPEHVKFIFATTEVNKIPITVLSRCQRFDLKRIGANTLFDLFTKILGEEKVKFEEAAVRMISRAADGSARDGLSLLDQSIALSAGQEISMDVVAEMLGQADRTKVYDLFEALTSGEAVETVTKLTEMYEGGHDPLLLMNDLLQVTHLVTRLKVVSALKESGDLSEIEKTRGVALSEKLSLENLSRVYQMLLNAAGEARQADRPYEAVEMAVIRTVHLAALPPVADLVAQGAASLKKILAAQGAPRNAGELPEGLKVPHPAESAKPMPQKASVQTSAPKQVVHNLNSWKGIVEAVRSKKEGLAVALELQVRPIDQDGTHLTLEMLDGFEKGSVILKNLLKTLQEMTGEKWTASESDSDSETLSEVKKREADERIEKAMKNSEVRRILEIFPEAQVVKVDVLGK